MMQPTWLFEADIFGVTADPLKAEIRRQGMRCEVTRQDLLARGLAANGLGDGACVIACGSFPFIHHIQTRRRWKPGAWCNAENFSCATYYPQLAAHVLNAEHEILTSSAAVAECDDLFERFGRGGHVFVRPAGCQKTFAGRTVTSDDFADIQGPARYDPTTLVVVAPPRLIHREWRLVVAGDQIVAGSQYFDAGKLAVLRGIPDSVRQFAERVLGSVVWRPDPIFMLDICDADDSLRVLEIGPFSTCAFYDCDPADIVSTASQLAANTWVDDA